MRILIAEDQPQLRALLHRVLEHVGYEVTEAGDGVEAVERANQARPHLILMDLDMPRMSGLEAIRELRSNAETAAVPVVVLSAYSQPERVREAIAAGAADFLVKSQFRIESVIDRLRKAAGPIPEDEPEPAKPRRASGGPLDPTEVRRRLEKVMELKALPCVAAELIRMTESSGSDARALTGVIERDQALTARVLRLSNSAFYALHGRIHNLTQAIARVGMRGIREIALAITVVQEYSGAAKGGLDRIEFWKHSLACASLAKEIVTALGLPPDRVEEAFLSGLLHDIGKAILDEHFPEEHAAARAEAAKSSRPLHEVERERFGLDHTQVARFVLEKWNLPEALWDPITRHHEAWSSVEQDAEADRKMVGAVWAANILAKAGRYGFGGDDTIGEIPDGPAALLKLDADKLTRILDATDRQVGELTQILLLHDERAAKAKPAAPAAERTFALVREGDVRADALRIALQRMPGRAVKDGEPAEAVVVVAGESAGKAIADAAGRKPRHLIVVAPEPSKELRKAAKAAGATVLSAPVSLAGLDRALQGGKKSATSRRSSAATGPDRGNP